MKLETKYSIYFFIDNLGNPFYVGQTQCFKRRFKEHLYRIKKGKKLSHYKKAAFLMKNKLSFKITEIHNNLSKKKANILELFYISKYNLNQINKPITWVKHGKCDAKVYKTWNNMLARCLDPKNKEYFRYGKRGIKVCKRWHKFENFYLDMEDPPTKKHSLDRINNSKGYNKNNCRWATMSEQARNTRRTRILRYKGKNQSMIDWSEQLKIPYFMLRKRITDGWTVKDALETPYNNHRLYITYKGITKSLKEWSNLLKINKNTLRDRIFYMQWPPEKSFKPPKKKIKNYILTYQGKTKSLTEWANLLRMNRNTLRLRIQKGYSLDKAFNVEVKKPKVYTYKNKTKTLKEWATYIGIHVKCLRDRLYKLNWSLEKSLTYKKEKRLIKKMSLS